MKCRGQEGKNLLKECPALIDLLKNYPVKMLACYLGVMSNFPVSDSVNPGGGTSTSGSRGLGPDIKIIGKIWGKVQPSSPDKRKSLGTSVTKRRKSRERIKIGAGGGEHLGLYVKFKGHNLGHLSPIFLKAKFGAPTRISEANFRAKPSDLLIWK